MCVSEAGGDDEALIRVVFHPDDGFVAVEEAEAGGDDVDEIRFHRHDRTEAPENPEDDLLQLEHASNMGAVRWGVGWCFRLSPSRMCGGRCIRHNPRGAVPQSNVETLRDLARVYSLSPLWGEGGVWGAGGR